MNKFLVLAFVIMVQHYAYAQHQEVPEKPQLWKGKENLTEDTTSILHAFKKGQMHGHFRYYFMHTNNKAGLSDYYANAAGGGIKYETARFKGFQFGVSGFFVFNIGSSNLAKPDPTTNQINRYELGLFDVEDPANKNDIDRLEELYLKYNWNQSYITFGKQLINTPFINLQDGRMRPTEVGGFYGEVNSIKNIKIEAGWLYEISPRSTVGWYNAGRSIGLYPQGVNVDGTKSAYKDNLNSKGIAVFGITHKLGNKFSAKFHNVYTQNVFNAALLQADYVHLLQRKNKIAAAIQCVWQHAVNNGGNEDAAKTYFTKGGQSYTMGAKLGWENERLQASLNYNRITAHGRYLMPREWGRDPFFTFLPRERNEGLGDVNAYVLKASYSFTKAKIKIQSGFGYYKLPDVTNYRLNKYGLPSYTQLNIDVRHEFKGVLKGMELQLLFVYKGKHGEVYENDKYVINKVQMSLWNFMLNYHF